MTQIHRGYTVKETTASIITRLIALDSTLDRAVYDAETWAQQFAGALFAGVAILGIVIFC